MLGVVIDRAGDGEMRIQLGRGDSDLRLWAAASRSARRTSGRRRIKSAGMPTTTRGAAVGIGWLPNICSMSRGGIPMRMQSWLVACRRAANSGGMVASVCDRFDSPWVTSSLVVAPFWYFTVANIRLLR